MSLLSSIAGLAEDKGADAIEDLLGKAAELADEHLDGPEAGLAKEALEGLSERTEELAHLGTAGVVALVTRWTFQGASAAKLTYLAQSATFEERRAASHAATADAVKARSDRDQAWETVKATLEDVGKIALKLIPLLLAAA